jgi:peroxiredoxin
LRGRYDEIRGAGGEIAAIGTGSTALARAFVEDDRIPFPVLLDADGRAAAAAAVRSSSFIGMFHPRTWKPTRETWRRGFRVRTPGPRVTQLGATFVLGPGAHVRYAYLDRDSTDHAPLDDVLAALR